MNNDAYEVKRDLESDEEAIETLDYETMENEEGKSCIFFLDFKLNRIIFFFIQIITLSRNYHPHRM